MRIELALGSHQLVRVPLGHLQHLSFPPAAPRSGLEPGGCSVSAARIPHPAHTQRLPVSCYAHDCRDHL